MMRAAVFTAPGQCELVERELPVPDKGEVLVRVEACGLCGTDLHIYHGEFPAQFPVVAGHEFAGIVEETGPGVDHLRAGDRVAIDPNIPCGTCPPCVWGLPHLCRRLSAIGVTRDGGFATHCVVPARQAHKLSSSLPFAAAALAEPVACCLHGIQQASVQPGDTVMIIGAGLIGLVMVQLALLRGASAVVVSELSPAKREQAVRLGAARAVDPRVTDLASALSEVTGEAAADVVIECVGSQETAQQAVGLAREGGRVLFFGVAPQSARVSLAPYEVYRKELTIAGSFTNPHTQGRALALLEAGRVRVAELVSHTLSLDQLVTGLELMAGREATKVLIHPQQGK